MNLQPGGEALACGYTIAAAPGSTFQSLLTRNAAKCAAAGMQPWTAQYFSDPAPIFLGLANGKAEEYLGATSTLKYDAAHVADDEITPSTRNPVPTF